MKKNYNVSRGLVTFLLLICTGSLVQAQAFRRGSLLVSISEGSTMANYSTRDIYTHSLIQSRCIHGDRDPIVIEYGISKRWGLGLSSGTDIFKVNSGQFYGLRTSTSTIKATTAEFTFDGNYHVFVNKRLDLSVFSSLGFFSVNVQGKDNDNAYKYTANGHIIRMGTRARYYIYKRLGVIGMLSSYAARCSPQEVKGNTFGNHYATALHGFTVEMGLCYRILK